MKKKAINTESGRGENFFGKIRRSVSDLFYGLSVKTHSAITKNKPVKPKKLSSKGGRIFYWVMFALPLLQFAIFYIGVNLNSILLAFKQTVIVDDGTTIKYVSSFVWFDTFKRFIDIELTSSYYAVAIKNSLIYFGVSVVIVIPLGLLLSFYVYKKYPLSEVFRTFLFMPSVICSLVLVIFYQYITGSVITDIIKEITGESRSALLSDINTAYPTLVVFNFLFSFGPATLIYVNAMSQIDPSVIEAAELDGAVGMRQFTKVVLPQIFPSITSYIVICIAQFAVNQLSGYSFYKEGASEYECQTIGYMLFTKVLNNAEENYPIASAGGILFTLIVAPVTIGIKTLLEKFGPSEN